MSVAASISIAIASPSVAGKPEPDRGTLESLRALTAKAMQFHQAGRLPAAIETFEKIAEIARQKFGADDLKYAQALNNLAISYDLFGELEKAAQAYRLALEVVERHQPAAAVHLAEINNNLAAVVLQQCRLGDAQKLYRRALNITEASVGPRHRMAAMVRENVNRLDRYLGTPDNLALHTGPIDKASSVRNDQMTQLLTRCVS